MDGTILLSRVERCYNSLSLMSGCCSPHLSSLIARFRYHTLTRAALVIFWHKPRRHLARVQVRKHAGKEREFFQSRFSVSKKKKMFGRSAKKNWELSGYDKLSATRQPLLLGSKGLIRTCRFCPSGEVGEECIGSGQGVGIIGSLRSKGQCSCLLLCWRTLCFTDLSSRCGAMGRD